jgi:hypothetical protein
MRLAEAGIPDRDRLNHRSARSSPMRYRAIKPALLPITFCLALSCSGAPDGTDSVESLQEPVFGPTEPETLLQLHARDHAVALKIIGRVGGGIGRCSGTQIRRNIVVTARHCVTSNGEITGTPVLNTQIFVGRPGLPDSRSIPSTHLGCLATLDCTTVQRIEVFAPSDLAILYLPPTEFRFADSAGKILDDILYAPLVAPVFADVASIVGVAAYGRYNPFSASDPLDFQLNFGTLQILGINQPNTVGGNAGGVTQKMRGLEDTEMQGGDSGSGVWTRRTRPPGLVAVASGSQNCTWDEFCSNTEGPTPAEIPSSYTEEGGNGWGRAKDWEFDNAAEANDFDIIKIDTGAPSAGWQLSSGNFTPWNNANDNIALARTVMDHGCVTTQVRTSDDDESGIVFRYMDSSNFYTFVLNDSSDFIRIYRYDNGVRTKLASKAWTGTFDVTTKFMACFYDGRIQAFVNPGAANELGIFAVEAAGTYLLGGRIGMWNNDNEGARHGHLRTLSISEGSALVLGWVRL